MILVANKQKKYLDSISNILSWLVINVKQQNKANWTDTTKMCEGFYREFISVLIDCDIVNLNIIENNAKGIDLICPEQKLIFQVSSTCDRKKIQDSLNKIDIEKYNGYHYIFILIGTNGMSIKKDFDIPNSIVFNYLEDIWDNSYILRKCENISIDRLKYLSDLVDKYFGDSQNNMVSPSIEEDDHNIETSRNDVPVGYCINFGTNCCRIFVLYKDTLHEFKEMDSVDYSVGFPVECGDVSYNDFIEELISITQQICSQRNLLRGQSFVKVMADSEFNELFLEEKEKDRFITNYYQKTGFYFNILTTEQTEENMKVLFKEISEGTAIFDICPTCVHIVLKTNSEKTAFKSFNVKITTNDIRKKLLTGTYNTKYLQTIKEHIKETVSKIFGDYKAHTAIIIKDELTFMERMGYPLLSDGQNCKIEFYEYCESNKAILFNKDFEKKVDERFWYLDENKRKKYYGYREGHLILECMFKVFGVKTIIPSNIPNMLRSPFAFVFNIVLSGSTKSPHSRFINEAYRIFKKELCVNIVSPDIDSLSSKSDASYRRHAQAIKNCDLLFVCNGDGYIGNQTKCDIYGAYLLSTPIAYWKEPNCDSFGAMNLSTLIPHDVFGDLLEHYIDNMPTSRGSLKGCVIGSFRKYYNEIVEVIELFQNNNIQILSPKKSTIVNPDEEFVYLASDDINMTENQIQSMVFHNARLADFVYVWDSDGYVGKTTCYEIGRIIESGIPLYFKEIPKDIPLQIPSNAVYSVGDLIDYYYKKGMLPIVDYSM